MKNKSCLLLVAGLALLAATLSPAFAQGTAFTYQGRLDDGGAPANGRYDFTFGLFNSSSTNTGQVGGPLTRLGVGVTNGLFTAALDFGANFPGVSRWLAISVRTNGGAGFTPLNPLQELTPTPYAIYANVASNLTGLLPATQLSGTISNSSLPSNPIISGTITAGSFAGSGSTLTSLPANAALLNAIQTFTGAHTFAAPVTFSGSFTAAGPVGIGLLNPQFPLQVAGEISADYLSVNHNLATGQFQVTNNITVGGGITAAGPVGIGMLNPQFPLQVAGEISADYLSVNHNLATGQLQVTNNLAVGGSVTAAGNLTAGGNVFIGTNYAVSSAENLRIVHGNINYDGSLSGGSGFTVAHTNGVGIAGSGIYQITFAKPFNNSLTVTVTPFSDGTPTFAVLLYGRNSASGFGVEITQLSIPFDDSFNFIAIGN